MTHSVIPFSLKDAPALIERLLPVQKLSAEAYKEQMAGSGKTLTALGSYWKGRKPLILNKACILGCLLPATDGAGRDLEIFEKLMAMDDESFAARWKRRPRPKEILGTLAIARIKDYFTVEPENGFLDTAPVDWSNPDYAKVKVTWRDELLEKGENKKDKGKNHTSSLISHPSSLLARRRLEAQMLPDLSYRERVEQARRPEEVMGTVHDHIWGAVNAHLGTSARSFPELVEQLGIMRFGHRPRVADTFCGSGQIPFEAARLGCDVYASDLNPIACMLTWGALNIVGGSPESRGQLAREQHTLVRRVQEQIDALGVETDDKGWRAKVFLYCVETTCPQTGWSVPLLPNRVISKGYRVIAELAPVPENRRYEIQIRCGVTDHELKAAESGTVGRDSKYDEAYLIHQVEGMTYKTKISTLRGDYRKPDGSTGNRLRQWERQDFVPRADDLLQERLYCVQWMRRKTTGKGYDYQFRTVTPADLERERVVEEFVAEHIADWQEKGWLPNMHIEVGGPPRYQGLDLIKARGWTHWQHVFNPRQLLVAGLINQDHTVGSAFSTVAMSDQCSKLSRWNGSASKGAGGNTSNTFDNQALNTIYTYANRGLGNSQFFVAPRWKSFPIPSSSRITVNTISANAVSFGADIFVSDPPYGNAVKYEEILDLFIAWLRRSPPSDFNWTWDSRRTMAIQGEGEDFRREMVAAYQQMTKCMPDNGIQVIMFTHQSGAIWADMANIVWASGLQVTAAWYVVTETDSALRAGSYVKGTVLLVVRKRMGTYKTTRDDLAWEIQDEVKGQVEALAGLNQQAKGLYRDESVFEDADIQMAGYAAALRVLTRYAIIDGRDMTAEAIRPRVKGETTFVDGLIAFAVDTANQCLVPRGLPKTHWDKLTPAERFYLKMLDLEARGAKTLDNYQNFAKAFKVRDFRALMGDQRANHARLKSAVEFGRAEISEGSELYQSVLRAALYAVMELVKDVDSNEVLAHLTLNIPNYYGDMTRHDLVVELADYLAKRLEDLRPEEARAARVLCELVRNRRVG